LKPGRKKSRDKAGGECRPDGPPQMTKISRASRKRSSLPWSVMAFCAVRLTMGSSCLAADDLPNLPATQAASDIETLLRKVEDQVAAGHAVSPAEDSGIETWKQVLRLEVASPDSPVVRVALVAFMARMRTRAEDEKVAGRLVVSSDLTLFAEQARHLLEKSSADTWPPVAVAPNPSQTSPPSTEAVGAVIGATPTSPDGHPTGGALVDPDNAAVASTQAREPTGSPASPKNSSTAGSVTVSTSPQVVETEPQVENAAPADAPPKPPHRARPRPYKPWPPLTELPVMLPQPPPPPPPPLIVRLFNWLRGQNKDDSR
jgi:hypothetical protein